VADAIVVLNAGSSSLKFETFFLAGPALDRAAAGIVEGRYSFQTQCRSVSVVSGGVLVPFSTR
jgi:acetate kinase